MSCLFSYGFDSFWNIFQIQILDVINAYKYFLPVCDLCFHSLNNVLQRAQVFNAKVFNDSSCLIFSLVDHVFNIISKISLPMFYAFIVLDLRLSLNLFWVNILYMVWGMNPSCSACFQHHLLKGLFLLPQTASVPMLNIAYPYVISTNYYMCGYFCTSYSVPLVYLSMFTPMPVPWWL